jgi:NAD(P)H-dependent FMN reductase
MSALVSIVSGSTRTGRKSHRVALAIENELKASDILTHLIDLNQLPIGKFLERLSFLEEKPEELVEVSKQLQKSQGIIFVFPEYNGSISNTMKWFIDMFGKAEFGGKPIGVATVSNGVLGGMRAAQHMQNVILAIGAYPQSQMLLTPEVQKQFDEKGNLINESFRPKLDAFIKAYLEFIKRFAD